MYFSGSRVASRVYIRVDKIMEICTKKLRTRICVGYIEGTSVGNTECSSVCLHSVVLVSVTLVFVLSDSPCEGIGKGETSPMLKVDRSLVHDEL
jgi:hypothetical protein